MTILPKSSHMKLPPESQDDYVGYNGESVHFDNFAETCVHIRELDLYWQFAISPNRKFRLAWESQIPGRIVLLFENQILWQRKFIRPMQGAISNKGLIVINDALAEGGNGILQGRFYLLSPTGDISFVQQFSANLGECGITDNIAWCRTYRSNIEEDSSKLSVFSLSPIQPIFKIDLPSEFIEKVDLIDGKMAVQTKDFGECLLTLDGKWVNFEDVNKKREERIIRNGDVWELMSFIDDKIRFKEISQMQEADFRKVLSLMSKASPMLADNPHPRAKLERQIGEMLIAKGHVKEAVKHLEMAVSINPKVGVQKMLKKLKSC